MVSCATRDQVIWAAEVVYGKVRTYAEGIHTRMHACMHAHAHTHTHTLLLGEGAQLLIHTYTTHMRTLIHTHFAWGRRSTACVHCLFNLCIVVCL